MPPPPCRQKFVSAAALGRSSLRGGGSLFPPCLARFSPSARQSPALSLASAALAQPCALTLDPCARADFRGFLFGRPGWRALRRASHRGGFPPFSLAFPPLVRACFAARAPSLSLPLCALASPRAHASQEAAERAILSRLLTAIVGRAIRLSARKPFNMSKRLGLMNGCAGVYARASDDGVLCYIPALCGAFFSCLVLRCIVNQRFVSALPGYILRIVVDVDA